MKRFLLASTALLASPAIATEYVTDTTFDNPANLSVVSGCAYGTGELIATAVLGRCAYKNVVAVHKGDHIKYTVTIRNYSSGSLQILAVAPPAAAGGSNVSVTDGINGALAISDNFSTNLGLAAPVETHPADDSTEVIGAFRFSCSGMPKFIADDPMVYHGKPGVSHPHMVVGNMGFNANSTERSLRVSGTSNCGSRRYPVQRSAYWMPAVENGDGDMEVPFFQNFYYKGFPGGNPACQGAPDATHIGICVPLPRSLRYLMGFNMQTMSGGSTAASPEGDNFGYECRQRASQGNRDPVANGSYRTIDAAVAAGCPAGAILYVFMGGMSCWDGTHLDTVDHRSHMAWPNGPGVTFSWTILGVPQTPGVVAACPVTHPYKLPVFSWQAFFITDASFAAGKWHLSSDDGMGMANGTTLHMDYWASWSPAWQDMWHPNCIDGHRSCSGGTDGVSKSFGGTPGLDGSVAKLQVVPIATLGRSHRLKANGTYTGEIIAAGDGQISLYSPDGLTAKIDNWRMDSVTKVNKATVTTHHTTH